MNEHIVSAYEDELNELGGQIALMGGLAERQLLDATDALRDMDSGKADRVIKADKQLDEIERDIEEQAILMIAKRQPMATDLREIMAAIRISSDLERIGDLAKNIAKRVNGLNGEQQPKRLIHGITHMSQLAMEHLNIVLDAYSQKNVEKAIYVWQNDEEIDAMYTSVFRELLTYMMEDPRKITSCTHLLFAAKNIERIGDHATNISETIYFLVKGEPLSDDRPKGDASPYTRLSPDDIT
ncbi:MAG: phosphate signaling complex protein PhoU [Fimbriimonadaceae bacterium]|nr:phosphate signaling complex protein PhoU [Alphaproteobacteria bacterium]